MSMDIVLKYGGVDIDIPELLIYAPKRIEKDIQLLQLEKSNVHHGIQCYLVNYLECRKRIFLISNATDDTEKHISGNFESLMEMMHKNKIDDLELGVGYYYEEIE